MTLGIDYMDEYGNVWFLDRDLFVDQSTPQGPGVVTISPVFLDEIRNGLPREKSPELIVTHEVIREIYAHLANPEEPCFLWEVFSHEESKYSNLVFPDPPPDGPLEACNDLRDAYEKLLVAAEMDQLAAEKLAASAALSWVDRAAVGGLM